MSTFVYVDGFNLYHRGVKNTPFKWLDVAKLCRTLLPNSQIKKIRYFTAHVDALPHDPQVPDRQAIYLRALKTIPILEMHDIGRFSSWPTYLPRWPFDYPDPAKPPTKVQVLKTEEKGSDVNLATYLLVDCFDNAFETAVVISNDSDLTLPIEMATKKFGKTVGVINPNSDWRNSRKVNKDLNRVASFYIRMINKKVLANCQFPETLTDAQGTFHKPPTW